MSVLQESAQKAGAKYVGSSDWNLLAYYDTPVAKSPANGETFARGALEMASDRLLSHVRWRYGRQCKLFMEGYFDGLPEHLSLFGAFEMMKQMAPSYFKDGAE